MNLDERTMDYYTSCQHCYFAVWDKNNKQIGCQVNRIQKYIDRDIVELQDEDNKTFYVIKTFCSLCRSHSWASKQDNPVEKVYEQNSTPVDFIVVSVDQDDPEKKILTAFKNCCEQKLKPKSIVVIVKNYQLNYHNLYNELTTMSQNYDMVFKLTRITDDQYDLYKSIDHGVKQCKSPYFCVHIVGEELLPIDLTYKLDLLINKEAMPTSMIIYGDSSHGLICQRLLHKIYGGNNNMLLQNKIKEASIYQENEEMVKIWNNLK